MMDKKNGVRLVGSIVVLILALGVLILVIDRRPSTLRALRSSSNAQLLEQRVRILDIKPEKSSQRLSLQAEEVITPASLSNTQAVQADVKIVLKPASQVEKPKAKVLVSAGHKITEQPRRTAKKQVVLPLSQPAKGPSYVMTVASYQVLTNARNMHKNLAQMQVQSKILPVLVRQKRWYRVVAGPFLTHIQAAQAQRKIHKKWPVTGKLRIHS